MNIAMSQSTGQPIPAEISNSKVVKRTHSIYKTIQYKKYFTCPLYFKDCGYIKVILGKG